ncbi:MAG: glycoside hydrolase [Chitinophagaceae bacterium]|nr:glycoside hydrolase [Chitinophagaceae bacterium]
MKLTATCFLSIFLLSCSTVYKNNSHLHKSNFKVIGYLQGHHIDTSKIPFQYLTHINYSFAIPAKDSGYLQPISQPERLRALVLKSHGHNVEVFLSIGGWSIGDGGGNDTRFHKLSETAEQRNNFVKSTLSIVREFNLDGVDMDWEYPDSNHRSADDFVFLMKELRDSLLPAGKKLTAAVVSYGRTGWGVKNEVFELVDWLNLMCYDDDNGLKRPHAPYSLAVRAYDYWVGERGLPEQKAVIGLPFYGKPSLGKRGSAYRNLLAAGADPQKDQIDSIHYNGIKTIRQKTSFARQHTAGVMIWEISQDTVGKNSLLQAISKSIH